MKKICIVDDELDILNLECKILDPMYDVTTYTSPVDAYKAINNGTPKPDIIISDFHMPAAQDGLDFIERLKSDENTRYIPLIILSAEACKEHISQIFEKGADYFMSKPFTCDGLTKKVEEILQHHDKNYR